jgi:peptidyl-prolyl cis-trans isomerase SurA
MNSVSKAVRAAAAALIIAGSGFAVVATTGAASASEIRYIVNNQPVTSYDIQRRAAFLKLQRRGGNVNEAAAEEMIDQVLRMAEARRLNISISDDQVSDAYARFASSNNMSVQQLDQVLNQAGVTRPHFRDFIRAQMSWSQAVQQRGRSAAGGTSEQDVVQRMLQQGGDKPSATEYMLQQVIFVVPAAERGAKLGTRKREAEALRQRFTGCDSTREFARGLLDVTVRDLGRVLEPELPGDWAQSVKATSAGSATQVRETERGVEFIGVCSAREVSDDRVAQMVFQSEQGGSGESGDEVSKTYTAELRERASIIRR